MDDEDRAQKLRRAERLVADKVYSLAAGLFEEAREYKKAKKCAAKAAKELVAEKSYDDAARYYEKAYMINKARECWKKEAEKDMSQNFHDSALIAYQKSGLNSDDATVKVIEGLIEKREYDGAEIWYVQRLGLTEKEARLKIAEACFANGIYHDAIAYLKKSDCQLADIPKKIREELLMLVTEGNIEVTQSLASLVKSEEDELIFNEARAGMVL
jgi:tetratricopeptide (TPR) repeat protein